MNKKWLFILVLLCSLTSCKNFMQETWNSKIIDSLIEYTTNDYVNITLTCDSNALKVMIPSVGQITKYKAGDKFEISFEPKNEYQFVKWICEPADSVTFESEEATKTVVNIVNGQESITIYPQVFERPTVNVSPAGAVAVAKNSQIGITFSQEMELDSEIANLICIVSDDVDVKENFEEPIISEDKKTITFLANEENLIDFESGEKNIKVSIPKSFCYLKDDVKVTFLEDQVFSYKIKPETLDKLILVTNNGDDSWGNINVQGAVTFNMQQKIDINFATNSDYQFIQWQVKKEDSIIKPEDYKKIIEISDIYSTNITVKALKPAQNFQLEAYCLERPKITDSLPELVANGVYYDKKIEVFFNSTISNLSIYYTIDELKALNIITGSETLENTNTTATGYTLLKTNNNCYGYSKDGNIVWKNITIVDENTNENLLKCYKTPIIDVDTGNSLTIYVSDLAQELAYKNIQTTIANFGYVKNNSFVTIKEAYSFTYKTNNLTDTKPPVLKNGKGETSFKVRIATGNSYSKTDVELLETDISDSYKNLKSYNINNNGLWVYGIVEDKGVGLENISWKIEKIPSSFYEATKNENFTYEKKFSDNDLNEPQFTLNNFIDLKSLNIPAGCYKFTIKAWDVNENPIIKEFYFDYDKNFSISKDDIRTYVHPNYISIETKTIVPIGCSKITVSYNDGVEDFIDFDITGKMDTINGKLFHKIDLDRNQTRDTTLVIKYYDSLGNSSSSQQLTMSDSYQRGMICYEDARFSMNYYEERKGEIVGIAYSGNIKQTTLGIISEQIISPISYDVSSFKQNNTTNSDYFLIIDSLQKFNEQCKFKSLDDVIKWNTSEVSKGTYLYQLPIIRGHDPSKSLKYTGDINKYISWYIPSHTELGFSKYSYNTNSSYPYYAEQYLNKTLSVLNENNVIIRNNITKEDQLVETIKVNNGKLEEPLITSWASTYDHNGLYRNGCFYLISESGKLSDDRDLRDRTETHPNTYLRPFAIVDLTHETFYHGF